MFEVKLNNIENKVDKIQDVITDIKVTLSSQHEVLKEHIRRTELLEKEIKPIATHVDRIKWISKLIIGLASSEAAWYCIKRMFHV